MPSRASSFSEATLAALRYTYNTGMAAAWPLLANLALLLLPNERSLFLLSCAGASHEDGVRAHAWCGAAVWAWGTLHGEGGAGWGGVVRCGVGLGHNARRGRPCGVV